MRVGSWTASMAIVAVVAGAGAAGASAETVTFQLPFSGPVENTCTGEIVVIEGTHHFKATGNSSLDGSKPQLETHLTGAKAPR